MKVPIGTIAYARSGDKGGMANIGVAAREPRWYAALVRELTADVVQDYFSDRAQRTDRYELPNIHALNFLLHGILGKGGTSTLRLDPQGKALADAICFLEIELDDDEAAGLLAATETTGPTEVRQ
ncbi:AtuA-related protein [Spirillospora sp. CA-255316]